MLDRALADSFEVFFADDELEGGAAAERHLFDYFELIGESDALESGAELECVLS